MSLEKVVGEEGRESERARFGVRKIRIVESSSQSEYLTQNESAWGLYACREGQYLDAVNSAIGLMSFEILVTILEGGNGENDEKRQCGEGGGYGGEPGEELEDYEDCEEL